MKRHLSPALALVLGFFPAAAAAQPAASDASAAPAPTRSIGFKAFLAEVARSNPDLAAQRWGVPIAEAQIAVARVFPDPTLTAGLGAVDVSGKGSPTVTTVGLSTTIELGGKRGARIRAAQLDHAAARADLDDFLRTLRGTATGGFIDSLYARLVLARKRQTLEGLGKLVAVNRERVRAGDVGQVALTQSRVEEQRFRGEVAGAAAEVLAADLALALHTGAAGATRLTPVGTLAIAPRAFTAPDLVARAKQSRPDLASKRSAVEAAAARVELARANRWIDVTLGASWQHALPGSGPFAAPSYDSLSTTASVPIPLSRAYRGELDASLGTLSQSRAALQASELKVEIEIRQALARYTAAAERVGLYKGGLLSDADHVLEATLYSYQRGSASLLEVLDAQRTQNDVYLGYYEALADHARSLVALEQAAGMWDVDL